jgi:hypothetical protein
MMSSKFLTSPSTWSAFSVYAIMPLWHYAIMPLPMQTSTICYQYADSQWHLKSPVREAKAITRRVCSSNQILTSGLSMTFLTTLLCWIRNVLMPFQQCRCTYVCVRFIVDAAANLCSWHVLQPVGPTALHCNIWLPALGSCDRASWAKYEERKNLQDATIRCLLLTSVSTCFGHHYAHLLEIKGPVTAFGVLFWFCWMWLVAVVGRCPVGCEHYEDLC